MLWTTEQLFWPAPVRIEEYITGVFEMTLVCHKVNTMLPFSLLMSPQTVWILPQIVFSVEFWIKTTWNLKKRIIFASTFLQIVLLTSLLKQFEK